MTTTNPNYLNPGLNSSFAGPPPVSNAGSGGAGSQGKAGFNPAVFKDPNFYSTMGQATPQRDPGEAMDFMDVLGSSHKGASEGAAVGTSIMPGWGTAIGGIAGGLRGLGTGLWEYFESQDALREKREIMAAEQRRLAREQGAYNRDRFNQARENARLGRIQEEQSMAQWKYNRYVQNKELMRSVQDRMNSQIAELQNKGMGATRNFTRLGV